MLGVSGRFHDDDMNGVMLGGLVVFFGVMGLTGVM